ncbi:hypothetical protein [Salibacterium halotolerans]|uniref:hypothetical protein n=1 Tax=Salibacterium halotolerans TaxID=1884432 RepID=UPI000B8055F9|nr:hypothetical protein [Salibacterium halotolerans]
MHEPQHGLAAKPRTYRSNTRKEYLKITKQKQLQCVRRDFRHIAEGASRSGLFLLSRPQYRDLLVIQEVYRQQKQMMANRTTQIDHRIVSLTQPVLSQFLGWRLSASAPLS